MNPVSVVTGRGLRSSIFGREREGEGSKKKVFSGLFVRASPLWAALLTLREREGLFGARDAKIEEALLFFLLLFMLLMNLL